MNKKQKQKLTLLAIVLGGVLAIIMIFAFIFSCAGKDVRQNAATAATQRSGVVISEILASNKQAVRDPMGTYSDYVELYNAGSETVSIGGYGLSDSETDVWAIPEASLRPGEYYVIWCAGFDTGLDNVANFALSKDDVLRFIDPSGSLITTVSLSDTYSGLSYCYDPANGTWANMAPSPGYPNTAEGVAAYERTKLIDNTIADTDTSTVSSAVRVSEFMASNSSAHRGPDGTYCDWIELYNSSSSPVSLDGWGLSDDITKPKKFTFKDVTIEPNGFLVVYNTVEPVDGYVCIDFGLSSRGETLLLTTPEDRYADFIEFGVQTKNFSMARSFNGGTFDPDSTFTPTDRITPGFANTEAGYALFDKQENGEMGVHDIMFNEVLVNGYHIVYQYNKSTKSDRPFDADYGAWIELYNSADYAVDLGGYAVSDDYTDPLQWVFPNGTSIAAKGYLALQLEGSLPRDGESSATDEQRRYQVNFDIAAAGETLYLYEPDGTMIDRVTVPACHACISYGRDKNGEWVLFTTPTEAAPNPDTGYGVYCEAAEADTPSGIYHGAQTVNVKVPEGLYATYTTDTTIPTEESMRVSGPIAVSANTVLRVRTFAPGNASYPSDTKSYTYVIVNGEQTIQAHDTTLPVVFLVTDQKNLFDTKVGIYVKGDDYNGKGEASETWINTNKEKVGQWANFNMSGKMWERPATFTYTSAGGQEVLYSADLNIRIFGAFSRYKGQKGIGLVARKGVGPSWLEYPFFDNRPFTAYKSLVLRASGQDSALSRIRDVLVLGLLNDAGVDMANQAYVQCIVYLNDQYWGVYNLREKVSKFYLAQHYGVEDTGTIDILVGNGVASSEVVASNIYTGVKPNEDYKALLEYCRSHNYNLSNDADYQYVADRIDIDNFAQYCAFEIIIGNTDTGNIKWWRSSELDNKWRWIAYDFCWAMNREDPNSDVTKTSGYRRDFFSKYFNPSGHGAGNGFDTTLGRSLLSNNRFVERFLYYCADFFNNVYTPDKIVSKVDELQEAIRAEMEGYDLERWFPYNGVSVKGWNSHCNNIRNYGNNYQDYFLLYCQNYINKNTNYRLTDEKMVELFGRVSKLK